MIRQFHLLLFFSLSLAVFVLTGCVTVPQGYTPSAKLEKNVSSRKYDVTYSLSYASDGDSSVGRASESRLREIIGDRLRKSGYFSHVTYKNPEEKSPYHIHFIAHYSMLPVDEAAVHGMLIGYTFLLIPSWVNMYLDLSAILMHENQKIYSSSTSENLRCFIWLPLAPLGILWNNWIAWTVQEKKCVNYVLNDLTEFQRTYFQKQ